MDYPVFSVRDNKVGFGTPFTDINEKSAIRGFSFSINGREGIMNANPSDYDLYKIGIFHVEKGVIEPLEPIELIVSGSSVVNR